MNILVVDDDEEILFMAEYALARDGRARAVTALGGAAALERLRTATPDAILADVRMEGLGGLDLLRAVRRIPGLESVPVVFLTGLGGQEFRREAAEAGAAGVLAKPFDPARLADDLFRLLPARPSGPAAPRNPQGTP